MPHPSSKAEEEPGYLRTRQTPPLPGEEQGSTSSDRKTESGRSPITDQAAGQAEQLEWEAQPASPQVQLWSGLSRARR